MKVTVTDSNNNDAVVLIGFVKYTIVERLENLDMGVIHTFNHEINCNNYVVCPDGFATTWNEFQYHVLDSATSLSYVEFNTLYKLETNADGYAIQYDNNYQPIGTDSKLDVCPRKAGTVGVVQPLDNVAVVGDNDNGLYWQLSACELRDIYWNHNGHAEVMVSYRRINPAHSTKDPIFVRIAIDVTHKFNEVGKVEKRLADYWYKTRIVDGNLESNPTPNMDPEAGTRANVQEPTDYSDTKDFYYSLTSAWYDNVLNFGTTAYDYTKDGYKHNQLSGTNFSWWNNNIVPVKATDVIRYYDDASYPANILSTVPTAANQDGDGSQFYFHPANNSVVIVDPMDITKKYYLTVESTKINVGCSCNNNCDPNNGTVVGHDRENDGHLNQDCHCGAKVCPTNVTGTDVNSWIASVREKETNYYLLPTQGTIYTNDTLWVGRTPGAKTEILATIHRPYEVGSTHDFPWIQYHWDTPDNTIVKEVLNLTDHKNAIDYLYVGVYGMSTVCRQYVKPVDIETTGDNVYSVHFLRPITAVDKDKDMIDAMDNMDKFWVVDLFADFHDWREVRFLDEHVWYYAYYNVKGITVEFSKAKTNLHDLQNTVPSTWPNLVDVSTEVKFYHYGPQAGNPANQVVYSYVYDRHVRDVELPIAYNPFQDAAGTWYNWVEGDNQAVLKEKVRELFGQIRYTNNRGNVSGEDDGFDIFVPVKVAYDWGYLPEFWVRVHVDRTLGN